MKAIDEREKEGRDAQLPTLTRATIAEGEGEEGGENDIISDVLRRT